MPTSSRRGPKPTPLGPGDVIKTHPRDGFWGCAVVLTAPRAIGGLRPLCHIGITPLVLMQDYDWPRIADTELSILEFDRGMRIAPNTYATRHEMCIGQYTSDPHPLLPVIGRVDPARVFGTPLTFEVGDGTDGKYPLCGPIKPHLGAEAVAAWLRLNDPLRWKAERDEARVRYERTASSLKEEERRKRQERRRRKGGA